MFKFHQNPFSFHVHSYQTSNTDSLLNATSTTNILFHESYAIGQINFFRTFTIITNAWNRNESNVGSMKNVEVTSVISFMQFFVLVSISSQLDQSTSAYIYLNATSNLIFIFFSNRSFKIYFFSVIYIHNNSSRRYIYMLKINIEQATTILWS